MEWSWKVEKAHPRADRAILEALEIASGQSTTKPNRPAAGAASAGNADSPSNELPLLALDHDQPLLPILSRNQLQTLIEAGHVTVDGQAIRPNRKLPSGALVKIHFPAPPPTQLIPEPQDLEILYEDSHLLILNKPAGLTVHPSPTQMTGTLVHALLHYTQNLSAVGGGLRPGIVHRLDKDTSGALVITKDDLTHHRLAEVFSRHDIERTYWALCFGAPAAGLKNPIESLIGRDPGNRKKMSMKIKTGKKAVTYFKKLEDYGLPQKKAFASWLAITLDTGRTHQIRVHLNGIGHSILGDPVYGAASETQPKWRALPNEIQTAISALSGQALHARTLGFMHPITGEKISVEARPPAAFEAILQALKKYYRET